jgi:RNA polymerase sigma-70 factor (ECF subfamily)
MAAGDQTDWLTARFEEQRPRLRSVAYRMLGSASEADDALQEAWLRLNRASDTADEVDNLPGWLTTIVARVCLNALRARQARREEPLSIEARGVDVAGWGAAGSDPASEAELAESVGVALLVVLDLLSPAERLAFVLHDLFDLPFQEIAPIVGRSPGATRQLASRARRRVRGGADEAAAARDLRRQRRVVDAYLEAVRAGDFEGLVRLLDPDVVLRADATALPDGRPTQLRGAEVVARGALASSDRARYSGPALVDGTAGIVMAPAGRLFLVLSFEFGVLTGGSVDDLRITAIDVIADPERLDQVDLGVLDIG